MVGTHHCFIITALSWALAARNSARRASVSADPLLAKDIPREDRIWSAAGIGVSILMKNKNKNMRDSRRGKLVETRTSNRP
jgi:hypothetical protein